MRIEFKPIDKSNYVECIELTVAPGQEDFVAPNIFSLVQAAYEPADMYPLGIYKDGKLVGFILYDFDCVLCGWSMSRFMIGKEYQGQGIGSFALQKFIELFFNKHGVNRLYTSVAVSNLSTIALYEKYGFKKGEILEYEYGGKVYKEFQMVLQL